MSKVRFTVSVPVYNAEKYLHECIDSILNQTFADFELLLVNDGSKDSSGKICDEYAAKDGRIRVFHKENQGPFATRKFATEKAEGEFCVFCDSDDFIDPGYFKRADELLRDEQCDIVQFYQEPYVNGKKIPSKPYWNEKKVFEGEGKKEFYTAMMTSVAFNSMNTKFVRSDLLKSDTLDASKYLFVRNGDDFLQSLYPIFNAKKIVFIPESFYNYRENPESITHTVNPAIYKSIFAVRSVIWNDYLNGTDILGEDTKRVFAARSARSTMNIVKLISQSQQMTDDEKIAVFQDIREHEFYQGFIEPNLNKADLERKFQLIYELFSRHNYRMLLSTMRIISKIKK